MYYNDKNSDALNFQSGSQFQISVGFSSES